MNILFAGKFDPAYNRTRVLIEGLQETPGTSVALYPYSRRWRFRPGAFRRLAAKADLVFLPAFTHQDLPLIRAFTRKPLIFDPLISRYLTKVFDYKKVGRRSPRALKNFLKDKLAMAMADRVLCDTAAHMDYFHRVMGIRASKLRVLPVGVNTDRFQPAGSETENAGAVFRVGFYGTFIPLHGAELIVEAAALLRDHTDIHFELLGAGLGYEAVRKHALQTLGLHNVSLPGWVPYDQLAARLQAFDLALGIFGLTEKADLVVPNKIFHYAAVRKTILTKDTPAVREIFQDGRDILLCPADAGALAEAILALRHDDARRASLAEEAYALVCRQYNHREIARRLLQIAEELLAEKSPDDHQTSLWNKSSNRP